MTNSPCIGICELDDDGDYCVGCYLSKEAIGNWSKASEEQKMQYNAEAQLLKQRVEDCE